MDKRTTPQSMIYRKRTAAAARLAEAERDNTKMLPLMREALSWIQIAEHEELVAENQSLGSC